MRFVIPRRAGHLALGAAIPWWHRTPHRIGRWLLAAGLALAAAAIVASTANDAATTVAALGTTRSVRVARHDLDIGDVIGRDDFEFREWPVGDLPHDVAELDPVGQVVVATIVAGEIISSRRLGPHGISGLAALVPDGFRAIAIPIEGTGTQVRVGDRVDMFNPKSDTDALANRRSSAAGLVAANARVIGEADTSIVVAVSDTEAAAVATALGQGMVVVAIVGQG
ncbi:MAG: SAF domain-containing protein [Actinomycetes bacterium]